MDKPELMQALLNAEQNGGTITYHFADDTKQVFQINKEVFFNERGKSRSLEDVLEVFTSIQHDLKATSFTLWIV